MKAKGWEVKSTGEIKIEKQQIPDKNQKKIPTLFTTDTTSPAAGFELATAIIIGQCSSNFE